MSDISMMAMPGQQEEQGGSLPEKILSAPKETWERIKAALKVGTREQAVELIQSDEKAAAIVMEIINASVETVATAKRKAHKESMATKKEVPQIPIADKIYPPKGGRKGGGVIF